MIIIQRLKNTTYIFLSISPKPTSGYSLHHRLNVLCLVDFSFDKILTFFSICISMCNSLNSAKHFIQSLLTVSDSFILMVILLTASDALLIILRKPAPLSVWVLTALGSCKHTHTQFKCQPLNLFPSQCTLLNLKWGSKHIQFYRHINNHTVECTGNQLQNKSNK